MSTTPFMVLILPDVSVTPGPEWAEELNTALDQIDAHDHTPGKGALITPAGMSINSDLSFGGFSATQLKALYILSQAATLTGQGIIYQVGGNLYYNNSAGTPVQITAGSTLNVSGSGAISAHVISSYPYTVVTGDAQRVLIIDTSAARTVNLPAATNNMFLMIKDGPGNAVAQNISVVPNGTDLIDGSNSAYIMDSMYQSIGLVSDGVSKWYVV